MFKASRKQAGLPEDFAALRRGVYTSASEGNVERRLAETAAPIAAHMFTRHPGMSEEEIASAAVGQAEAILAEISRRSGDAVQQIIAEGAA